MRALGLRAPSLQDRKDHREACLFFAYIARRLGMMLLVIVLAVTINFVIPRLMPGDPIEQQLNQLAASGGGQIGDVQAIATSYRAKFGLDQPVLTQYGNYWAALLHLRPRRLARPLSGDRRGDILARPAVDAGTSRLHDARQLLDRNAGSAAEWPGRDARCLVRTVGLPILLVSAVPYFLIGLVLLFVFATVLKLFPAGGGYPFALSPGFNWRDPQGHRLSRDPAGGLHHPGGNRAPGPSACAACS